MTLVLFALSLAAAGAFVYLAFRRELEAARASAMAGGRIAHTAAGDIEYAERGAGAPLLSTHGAGGGYDQGLTIAAGLAGEGFRVIAPSRFGYLRTPVPADASPAAQADAHAALLDALAIETAAVIGTSAGARSALELALRHPGRVTALVLLVPGTYAPESAVMVENSRTSKLILWLVNAGADFAWWAMGNIAPKVLIRFLGVPPAVFARAPSGERRRVLDLMRGVQPLSERIAGINLDSNPKLVPLPLQAIRAPTLIVSARDDLFNTLPAAQYAAGLIPNARLIVLDDGGHLFVGHEAHVHKLVSEFLAEAAAQKSS